MRKIIFLLLVMLILLIQNISVTFGLEQDEVSIILDWSQESYFQGEEASLFINFSSQCPDELKIEKIEFQFNWTIFQHTKVIDFSEDPVGIPSNDNYVFDLVTFQIPQNATEGINSFKIRIEGMQHGLWWYDFEWISDQYELEIKTDYQYLFNQMNFEINEQFEEIYNANYQNQEAKDLLENAVNEYQLSISLADQNKWQEAILHLENTSDLLNQAQEKEQQPAVDELTSAITTIIILILLGLIVSIIFGRKEKN